MANDFNASLIISTSEAVNNVRNLDGATKDLDKTLAHLHATMTANQGDADKMAKALKEFTVAQGQSNRNSGTRQQNLIREARLEREGIVNRGKAAELTQKQAQHEAKLEAIRRRSGQTSAGAMGNETRRNAESAARIANQGVLTTQRANTENARYEAQQHRVGAALATRSAAEDRAQLTTMRLAAAQERARNSNLALNDSLSNSRYLLYDVAQTYMMLSGALLALPVATTAVATAYEKDFAQVIRTTGIAKEDSHGLYNELTQLGREIPLTFSQFANIAAIAGQLGIAKDEIGAFTETVAKFGAASNVGIQEAATAFGRLENSFNQDGNIPDFYNRVGSAIAKVGVESAASETEIIAVTNQISAAGAQFGFTADQIVGLSGALASVRIRPELARGAFQRIMLNLSRAADEGSDSFDKFAKYTKITGQAAIDLFKNDPSAFFNKYIAGIKGTIASGTSVSTVLDDIGAKNVFDKQFILGLANGLKVYNKALKDSSGAFDEGTFLNESTKVTMETFAATLTKIGTALSSLGARLGGGTLEPLNNMANTVLNVISSFERLIQQQPAIGGVINVLLGIGAVTGVFLAFKAAQAFVLAGLVGLQQVMGKTAIAGALSLRGNLTELSRTMLMAKGASAQLATQILGTRTGMAALGFATQQTTASVTRFATAGTLAGHAAGVAAAGATRGAGAMRLFSGALGLVGGPIGALLTGLALIGFAFVSAEEKAKQAGDTIARALKNGADAGNRAIAEALTDRTVDSWITDVGSGGVGNHGKNVRKLADELGIDFNKIVASVAAGTDASKEFQKVQDAFAVGKGFKDFADLSANSNNLQNNRGELNYLGNVVEELGKKSAESSKDVNATDAAVKALGEGAVGAAPSAENLADGVGGVGDEAEDATTKIKNLVDAIFGIVDAEAATQGALGKLGEGLVKSTSLSTGDDGGRDNLANLQDVLRNAALEQQQLVDSGKNTIQQASANYIQFIDGLLSEMAAKGVDVSQVQAMADQAKGIFGSTFASGTQPTIKPVVDPSQVQGQAISATDAVQTVLSQITPTFQIGANPTPAQNEVLALAHNLAEITGWPYNVVVDALTNPATEKGQEVQALLNSIVNHTYTAPVGADTSAAITNVRNFANYAQQQLASVQNAYNQVAASAPTFAKYTKGTFKGVTGVQAPAGIRKPSTASVPQIAAPVQVAPTIPAPNFKGLNNGYNDAAKAAEKAGDAGKKAGEDMANGIDDATDAANDYASRLKTGLQSAFDKQYGLTKATDDYHSALNAIAKKREEDLDAIDEAIAKQKELNNSRDEDLVTARKAGSEKAISQKYGETDRAADYAQQEEEALLAAAAKQKDIDANNKTVVSLKAGIDNFTGYSDAAIANREALRNLESKMLDMITAYAATGASVDQVRAYSQRLTAQFQTDAGQVWKNRVEILNLSGDLGRYIGVVNSVPYYKETKIGANTAGAMNNLAAVNNAIDDIPAYTEKRLQVIGGMVFDNNRTSDGQPIYRVIDSDGQYRGVKIFNKGGLVDGYAGGGLIPGKSPANPNVDNLMASVDGKGMVKVRSGEFIVKQPAVDYWGLDMFKQLNNMKMPAFNAGGSVGGGRSGGSGGSGAVLVELTADNLAAIMRLADRPVDLYAGLEKLASTVNEGNKILASKGVK